MNQIRQQPCEACPYRKDVPPGVWVADEYAKLPPYDAETFNQPVAAFMCHATPAFYCNGWAIVHSGRGHDRELLALRLHPCEIPEAKVPMFASGFEAAQHGLKRMTKKSRAAVAKLIERYEHLRGPR
jgi:hypothetical protein